MGRWYIGQRVRIISARTMLGQKLVGVETTIRRLGIRKGEDSGDGWIANVDCDCELDCLSPVYPNSFVLTQFWRLEPISDSNTLVSWESMKQLWLPEHMREHA